MMSDQLFQTSILSVIGLLITVVGFFLVGLIRRVEKNNEALNQFCTRLEVLVENIKTLQNDTIRFYDNVGKSIDRHDRNIEMIRKRIHFVINKITVIKMRLELHGIDVGKGSDWGQDAPSDE